MYAMWTYFVKSLNFVTQTHSVDNFQIMSIAALELFVRDLMEWKLALLVVPTLIIAWLSQKFLFLDAFMSPLRNLPGPPTSMFLGNLLQFKRNDRFGATPEWSKKYGSIFLLWLRPGMYARTGEKCPCRAEMLVPAISLALKWVSCKENAFFEDYAKFSSSRKLLLFVLCSSYHYSVLGALVLLVVVLPL